MKVGNVNNQTSFGAVTVPCRCELAHAIYRAKDVSAEKKQAHIDQLDSFIREQEKNTLFDVDIDDSDKLCLRNKNNGETQPVDIIEDEPRVSLKQIDLDDVAGFIKRSPSIPDDAYLVDCYYLLAKLTETLQQAKKQFVKQKEKFAQQP